MQTILKPEPNAMSRLVFPAALVSVAVDTPNGHLRISDPVGLRSMPMCCVHLCWERAMAISVGKTVGIVALVEV